MSKKVLLLSVLIPAFLLVGCNSSTEKSDMFEHSEEISVNSIEENPILVKAPKAVISASYGAIVNLKNFLITDLEEFEVKFAYTFEGYGEMRETGASSYSITNPISIEGSSLELTYCGTYVISFDAKYQGKVCSESDAKLTVVSEDSTAPEIFGDDLLTYNSTDVSVEDILENYEISDTYYSDLTLELTSLDGVETHSFTSLEEGNHVVVLTAFDGLGNKTTKQISVAVDVSIYQDPELLKETDGFIKHDFDKYLGFGSYESSHIADTTIVKGEEAVDGNSLKVDYSHGGVDVLFTSVSLPLDGTYTISFDYKVLSENLPNYFCVGFLKDNGTQYNTENFFNGKTAKTGKFEFTWKDMSGNFGVRFFNLNADGSVIVIDNLTVTNSNPIVTDLSALNQNNGYVLHDFGSNKPLGNFISSHFNDTTLINNADSINGNSLKVSYANGGVDVKFSDVVLSLKGDFEVTFDYKILSNNLPNYFCVGFLKDGVTQLNHENIFSGKTAKVGSYDDVWKNLDGNYTFRFFNLNADSSEIVIDNIMIKNVTPSKDGVQSLKEIGGKVTHNFDDLNPLGNYEASHNSEVSLINDSDSITSKSLKVSYATAGVDVKFNSVLMELNGDYKVTFDYKILSESAPNYFCPGFLQDNGTQKNNENIFKDISKKSGTYEYTCSGLNGKYYFRFFNLNADGSAIAIDNITIERVK